MNSNRISNSYWDYKTKLRLIAILFCVLGSTTLLGFTSGYQLATLTVFGMLFALFLVLRHAELFTLFPLVTLFSFFYIFSINISPEKILLLLVFCFWLSISLKRYVHIPNPFPKDIGFAFGAYLFANILSFLINFYFVDLSLQWFISLIMRGLVVYVVIKIISRIRLLNLSVFALGMLTVIMFSWMLYTVIIHNNIEFFRMGHADMPTIYSYSILIQPNITSFYGVILFPIMFTCAIAADRKWQRLCFYTLSLMAISITFLGLSRSGIINLFVIGMFLTWRFRLRFQVVLFVIVIIFGAYVVYLNAPYLSTIIYRTFIGRDMSSNTRIDLIRVMWYSFMERPILGSGPGSFRYLTSKYYFLFRSASSFSGNDSIAAHSELAMILSETGLVGLGAFISLLYIYIKKIYLGFISLNNSKLKIIYTGLIGSLVGAATDSLFHQVLIHNILWFIIGLALAIPNIYRLTMMSYMRKALPNASIMLEQK